MRLFVAFVLASCYLLVLVGSVVRTTGSGLGCPDWPACFGRIVPPTDVSELPPDYRELFAVGGRPVAEFDVFKTWTEYLNRLLGVVVGLEMMVLVALAWKFRGPFFLSSLALVLTCVQGWIGALVVSSHLRPSLVSVHVFMAVAILFVLHLVYEVLSPRAPRGGGSLALPACALLAVSLVQLFLGTQVRGRIDLMMNAAHPPPRTFWIENLGTVFFVHRLFAVFVLVLYGLLLYRAFSLERSGCYGRLLVVGLLSALTACSGAILGSFALPALFQPTHLSAACLYLGTLFSVCLGECRADPKV